jgi:hypothetical protein
MARRLLALTTALFALSATSASAATICVPTGTGCDQTQPTLQGAINLAAGTPMVRDTIRLTAGDFTQNALVIGANPLDIVGAGQGTGGTILRSPNSGFSLDIQSPGSTVSNLRVRVEDQAGINEAGIGVSGTGAVADGITVLGEPGVDNAVGVIVRTGAILRNSLVQVPGTGNANDAISAEEGSLIENVSAAGDKMVDARNSGPPVVIRRLRSSTPSPIGIQAIGGGSVNVSDALIRLSGGPIGGGLYAETSSGGSPAIVARHVTVVGTGDAVNAGRGVYADGFDPGRTAMIDVRDCIFHALSTDLEVEASAPSSARIAIGYSNFNPAKIVDTGAGDGQVVAGAGNLLVNPGFVDGAAADFRLRADSPLLDRGFPGAGSTADLDGRTRPNDGNGDGVAVRDPGAFEYQRPASPPAVTDTSAPLFRILSRRLKLNRRGRVALVLRGPANETAASSGALGLRSVRGRRLLGRKSFSLRPSARTVVKLKLTLKRARRVRRLGKLRVILSVTVRDGAGNARTVRKRVMLRALPTRN